MCSSIYNADNKLLKKNVLNYIMFPCNVSNSIELNGIVLYCIVLYCIIWYCTVLYCIVLYGIVLFCIVLYWIVFSCLVLYYTVLYLYCIALYCIVLYCIVLYCIVSLAFKNTANQRLGKPLHILRYPTGSIQRIVFHPIFPPLLANEYQNGTKTVCVRFRNVGQHREFLA